jgi:hypothetical protein
VPVARGVEHEPGRLDGRGAQHHDVREDPVLSLGQAVDEHGAVRQPGPLIDRDPRHDRVGAGGQPAGLAGGSDPDRNPAEVRRRVPPGDDLPLGPALGYRVPEFLFDVGEHGRPDVLAVRRMGEAVLVAVDADELLYAVVPRLEVCI